MNNDMKIRADRVAPSYFVLTAIAVPLLVAGQFLVAGLASFHDAGFWETHKTIGFLISIPVLLIAVIPWLNPKVRPLRWWAILLLALYVVQVTLAALAGEGFGVVAAFHPFNALLFTSTSVVILIKIWWSHGWRQRWIPS